MAQDEVLSAVETFDPGNVPSRSALLAEEGFTQIRGRNSDLYRRKLHAFTTWYGQLMEGGLRRGQVEDVLSGERQIHEALTRSDLPLYFGDVLQRQMLAEFAVRPNELGSYVDFDEVPDFRNVNRHAVDGLDTPLDIVDAQSEYPEASVSESRIQYRVQKRGRIFRTAWEALVNDDLSALRRVPRKLARAAARTETKVATELFADANGPHASFYTVGNSNVITSNPVLSTAGVQTGLQIMDQQTDPQGEPISVVAVTLVIPPALRVAARNMASTLTIDNSVVGGVTGQTLRTTNWLVDSLTIVINDQLPKVSSTANGNTSWYLFANPSEGRPAVQLGFLRGFRNPQMFMKASNQVPVGGGGETDPMGGDFETDTVSHKVRHIIGGTRVAHQMTAASNGSGS